VISWFRRQRPPLERDVVTFSLENALTQDGCALCWLLANQGRRSLWYLLWERVNEPSTQERLRADLGYCAGHTWLLCEIETKEMGSFLGITILFASLMREAARRLDAGQELGAGHHCEECRTDRRANATYLSRLVQHLEDPTWAAQWGPRLRLCLPHSRLASVLARGEVETILRVADQAMAADRQRLVTTATPADGQRHLKYVQDMFFGYTPDSAARDRAPRECPLCRAEAQQQATLVDWPVDDSAPVPCRQHAPLFEQRIGLQELLRRYLAAAELIQPVSIPTGPKLWWKHDQPARPEIFVPPCPVCAALARQRPALAAAFWQDLQPRSQIAFQAPLCLSHLDLVLAAAPDQAARVSLRREQASRLRMLAAELDELARKQDWNHRDEPLGPELRSWRRAANCLSGWLAGASTLTISWG